MYTECIHVCVHTYTYTYAYKINDNNNYNIQMKYVSHNNVLYHKAVLLPPSLFLQVTYILS